MPFGLLKNWSGHAYNRPTIQMKMEWKHKRPRAYYAECVRMFGKPDAESWKEGGFAIWYTRGLFTEHILRDEDVRHCVPRPHHDYFYSSIRFYVPDDKLCDVLKISGSLNYDGLKKLLTARCGAIGANYATLYLAMAVASGKLTIKQVKSNDMYPRMINGDILSREEGEKEMIAMKQANNKKYAKQLKAELATYAYKRCYKTRKHRSDKGGTRRHSRAGRNTRDEKCSAKGWTACCPHMPPDRKGRYAATNEETVLTFPDGSRYKLHTCCKMCGDQMREEIKNDYKAFVEHYKPVVAGKDAMWLHNKDTGARVQKIRRL